MSGPKVINLEAVRRRRQRDSLVRIRQLRDTVAEWRSTLAKAGLLTNKQTTEVEEMFRKLETLRQSEQWDPLCTEISARHEFFRTGTENAQQARITQVAAVRERCRRLELGVSMLRRELQAVGVGPPPELEEISRAGTFTGETEIAHLETLLQSAFSRLPSQGVPKDVENIQQRELAEALRTKNAAPQTVREWLSTRARENAANQTKNDRLARALAELELQAPAEMAAPLLEKARQVANEPAPDRRALLTDSLVIEADELCRSVRERAEALGQLRAAAAVLEPFQSAEADEWRQQLAAAGSNPSIFAIRQVAVAAQEWCTAEAAREEAVLRHNAVLKVLTALGYEVREGMAAAWAENGRVVVRKPYEPNYGVELASSPSGVTVQARVVAIDSSERSSLSAQRDREVEVSWCAEFQQARELLDQDGFKPTLLHATPAGELPVKVVPRTDTERRDLRSMPTQTQRQQENR